MILSASASIALISSVVFWILGKKPERIDNVTYGEITREFRARSRRGCANYWTYKQDLIIDGITYSISGPSLDWLSTERREVLKGKQDFTYTGSEFDHIMNLLCHISVLSFLLIIVIGL